MKDRLHNAEQYLRELIEGFGDRTIMVKQKDDGSYAYAKGKFFVQFVLTRFKIYPYVLLTPTDKTEARNINLSTRQVAVLFHEAMFEYLSAYIQSDHEHNDLLKEIPFWVAEKSKWLQILYPDYDLDTIIPFPTKGELSLDTLGSNLRYFDSESVDLLKSMGMNLVESTQDINMVLWKLAGQAKCISKGMVELLVAISVDKSMTREYIKENQRAFNTIISKRQGELMAENRKEEIEWNTMMETRLNELRREIKALTNRKPDPNKVETELLKRLRHSTSKLFRIYDFEYKNDREAYVKWFKLAGKPIAGNQMTSIKKHWNFSEDAWNEFVALVDGHNEHLSMSDNKDSIK